mmetsp:Transcript_41234/g.98732  ORF Transcript_41234/g.98732 Transcript_41234/m.98732 type:complete len:494 (-) Transcript_41234:41-1522(-)
MPSDDHEVDDRNLSSVVSSAVAVDTTESLSLMATTTSTGGGLVAARHQQRRRRKRVLDPILSLPVTSPVSSLCFVSPNTYQNGLTSAHNDDDSDDDSDEIDDRADDNGDSDSDSDSDDEEVVFRSSTMLGGEAVSPDSTTLPSNSSSFGTSSTTTTTNKATKLRHFATVFEVPPHPSEIPGIDVVSQHQQDGSTWWTLPCHPNIASSNNNKSNNGGQVAAAWTMYAAPLVHSIESVGYVFHEHPHQGKLDQTKLQTIKQLLLTEENRRYQLESCGIKNPLVLLGSLQRGDKVMIVNKNNQLQTLHPKDWMSPNVPGRKIVILGDTCDSRQLAKLAANADVIVHEATNAAIEHDETVEGVLRTAISRGHSTPGMAGTFAKCCQAKQLILTHFSSRYKGDDSPESLQVMSKIVQEAQESFGNDNAIAARDLMHISIAINRRERRRQEEEKTEAEAEAENDCIMRVQNTKNYVQPDVAARDAAVAADSFFKIAGIL